MAEMPTEQEQEIYNAKEQEIFNLEFDPMAIMSEQAYMDKLIFDVRDMLNVDVVTYGDSKKHLTKLIADKITIEKDINSKEKHINKLEESNPLKDRLRLDVIKKQDFLNKLKELEIKIGNKFSNFNKYENIGNTKISAAISKKRTIESEIKSNQSKIDNAYNTYLEVHKEVVDEKLNFSNTENNLTELDGIGETYSLARGEAEKPNTMLQNSMELIEVKDKEAKEKYDSYEHLLKDIQQLQGQLKVQNSIINNLEEDKNWLYNRVESKDLEIIEKDGEITDLTIKLNAWKSSYAEFESLVDALSEKVGYTEPYLKASGNEIDGENPLGTLIERLDRITKFIESDNYNPPVVLEEQIGVVSETKISPVLLGGLALGGLALTTFLNK